MNQPPNEIVATAAAAKAIFMVLRVFVVMRLFLIVLIFIAHLFSSLATARLNLRIVSGL